MTIFYLFIGKEKLRCLALGTKIINKLVFHKMKK